MARPKKESKPFLSLRISCCRKIEEGGRCVAEFTSAHYGDRDLYRAFEGKISLVLSKQQFDQVGINKSYVCPVIEEKKA